MKQTRYIEPNAPLENGIDFDAHYRLSGVAVRLLGWKVRWVTVTTLREDEDGNEFEEDTDESEPEADYSAVVGVMVGDNRHHHIDISDLVLVPEDGFCRSCGQIGCQCNVYE